MSILVNFRHRFHFFVDEALPRRHTWQVPLVEEQLQEACVFALMKLPQRELKRVLLKGSMRMIKYLVIAYPQAMGSTFLDALAPAVSPATLQVLIEEMNRGQILTPAQIRSAECEFIKLINQEKILPAVLTC